MNEAIVTIHTPEGEPILCRTPVGQTLMAVLAAQGLAVDAPCGGNGRCGKCRVRAEGALSPRSTEEARLPAGERLACLAKVEGDCAVWVRATEDMRVETDGALGTWPLTAKNGLGAAIDIGTTTVVVYLYDLTTGERLATVGAENRQRAFGADVISRITYTMNDPDGLSCLCQTIRDQLIDLLTGTLTQSGRNWAELTEVCVAGNTVMAHLFANLSPSGLAKLPFTPATLFASNFAADPTWLNLPNAAKLTVLPAVSAFVGGDITAASVAIGLGDATEPTILLDVGTNGEMALSADGRILCCATAAGPAFEGADIECGMSGTVGAIDTVAWGEDGLAFTVIGSQGAKGICGSGLIDLLAVLLELGAVDETGRLLPPDEAPECAFPYLRETDEGDVFFALTDTVYVTERDVRRLQLAKAAIAGGIATLLDEANLKAEAVVTVAIAGGFGAHLRPESAVKIGIYPRVWRDRAQSVGNAAGMGASAALLSGEAYKSAYALAETMQTIELSADPRFTEYYVEHMMFEE